MGPLVRILAVVLVALLARGIYRRVTSALTPGRQQRSPGPDRTTPKQEPDTPLSDQRIDEAEYEELP